jgi:hypothetical protein
MALALPRGMRRSLLEALLLRRNEVVFGRPTRRRPGGLGVVPKHVGSSGPPWRLSADEGSSVPRGHRMKLHANAALSWSGRRLLAERVLGDGWTLKPAAGATGVSMRCARKWVSRYRVVGGQGFA